MQTLAYLIYNFRVLFSFFNRRGLKLIPALLLISSLACAQNTKPSKPKKSNTRPKQKITKLKADSIVIKDSLLRFVEVDQTDSLSGIDPIDTVTLRKSKNAISSKVKYTARDSIIYSADSKTVHLYGEAKVFYDDLTLSADYIKIELGKSLLTALYTIDTAGQVVGLPKFKQGPQEYNASRIAYNYKTKRGYISELKTKEGEGYVKGQDVMKNESNELGIQKSYYTTCDADTPHFQITASKLKVIPEKKVVGLWPNLVIEGINTPLIFPFAIFPIKKGQSSGVIIPQYGSDLSRGFFLRGGGYYFGLGEHADLQLTGDIYSNLSWGAHSVFRYANRYHYNGNLTFNYASNQFGLPEDPGYSDKKDFQLNWQHMQDGKARPGTSFSANVNLVSSSYLALNSYNPANITSNQMASSIAFGKSMKGGKYNFSTNARVAQNVSTRDIAISFPDFTFSVSSFTPLKSKYKPVADRWYENISTSYNVAFRNEFASKDSLMFRSRTASEFNDFYDTTGRFGMMHSLPVQTSFKLFKNYTLSARVDMTDYWYYKTIRKEYNSEGKLITKNYDGFERAFTYRPNVSLNTRFYGMKQFKKGPVSAVRHVVIPTVDFSYQPDFSDNFWGYYRTYKDETGKDVKYSIFEKGLFGGPGMGKQGNIGFGLDNNLEMKVWQGKDSARKEQKIQVFESIRAGASYNIFADSMNLSNISLTARTRLFKNISINMSSQIDPYVNRIDQVGTYKTVSRVNKFYLNDQSKIGIIRSAQAGLSANFNQGMFVGKHAAERKGYAKELKYLNDFPSEYTDFDIPWTLTVNYTVGYDKYLNLNNSQESNFTQTLNYSGDFSPTKKWRVGYSSGYDFRSKQTSFTSINIMRDLHCWEFRFDWIPFGTRQSFLFTINVRASSLKELKQTRRREWFDRTI